MASMRKALILLTTDPRGLDRGLSKAEKQFSRFGRRVRRGLAKTMKFAATGLGIGAGFGIAQFGKEVLDFEDQLQRVASQARMSASETAKLRDRIIELSKGSGADRMQLLEGVAGIVNRLGGDAARSATNLDTLTKAMVGAGLDAKTLGDLMLAMKTNLKLTDDQIGQALSSMDAIGAKMSIPFSELASSFSEASGMAKEFGVTGVRGASQLTAAMQVLQSRFGSVEKVQTALTGGMRAFAQNEEKIFKDFGVRVRDAEGNFRPLLDIVQDLGKATGGDIGKLQKSLGRFEGSSAVQGLFQQLELIHELIETGDAAARSDFLGERYLERVNSQAGRLDRALNGAKEEIKSLFTTERIEKFTAAVEKFVELLEWAVDHARSLGIAFATLKVAPGAMQFLNGMQGLSGGGVGGGAARAGKGGKGRSGGGAGGALMAAAFGGMFLEYALDEATDRLDKEIGGKADTAFIRDKGRLNSLFFGGGEKQSRAAQGVFRSAEGHGFIKNGEADREAILRSFGVKPGEEKDFRNVDKVREVDRVVMAVNKALSVRGGTADIDLANMAKTIGEAVAKNIKGVSLAVEIDGQKVETRKARKGQSH